ncbi:hypothetical protein [Rhodoplanes sp. SY1]|uniref:hypothetical protein n=1 Tax=Rhodoplanes sp. SY1 TaxID=3166646 RepID=UPI0038B5A072
MRVIVFILLSGLCGACATAEAVKFQPRGQQEAMIRDGQAALVSKRKHSIVLVRPATRQFTSQQRPVFVVGINNIGSAPIEFRVSSIEVVQIVRGQPVALPVVSYEQLTQEERNRQVAAAVLTGLAAGANAAAAANAGRGSYESTSYGPRGSYTTRGAFYDPGAAAAAQARAAAQNDAMIANTVEAGQRNMAALEATVIKDNTLLPGEWYEGALHIGVPAANDSGPKQYSFAILVGPDRHEIDVIQEPVR